jgi:hypothetical protein
MTNYRTFKTLLVQSGSTVTSLENAWGVLPVNGVTGTVTLEGQSNNTGSYTTISLAHLTAGEPFPCYVRSVSVTNGGSVYLLA